jgi:hypothetical protein
MPETPRHRRTDRRHRLALGVGLGVSAVLHALLFLVFGGQSLPPSPFAAAGEREREARAAKGGGLEVVELRPPEVLVDATAVPVAVEEAEDEAEEQDPVEAAPAVALGDPLPSPGSGADRDPGLEDGVAAGDGGTEREGLFRGTPPHPRTVFVPPSDRPSQARGREIEVWVFVSASGQVVPDSTRLLPPTGNRRFDRRIRDYAAEWRFDAARRDGRAVAEWYRYTMTL